MHDIEPYYNWIEIYAAHEDERSPFYGREYSEFEYSDTIYGYYIHPQWDFIGSETLYIKVLFVDYQSGAAIIELFGEWNDAIHNDIMHLKRNIIDELLLYNINKYILIGENVFNFHGSDDEYYAEWFDDTEDGYIVAIGFRDFVLEEWKKYNLTGFIDYGEIFEMVNWRTKNPRKIVDEISYIVSKRLP